MVKNIAVNTARYHGQNNQTPNLISFGKLLYKTETQTNNEDKKIQKKMQNTRKTKNTNIILEKHKSNYIKQDIARLTLQVFERASRWIGESKTFFYKPVFF